MDRIRNQGGMFGGSSSSLSYKISTLYAPMIVTSKYVKDQEKFKKEERRKNKWMRSRSRSSSRFNSQKQEQNTKSITSQLKEKNEFWHPTIYLSSYSTSQLSHPDLFSVIDNQISNLNEKQKEKEEI